MAVRSSSPCDHREHRRDIDRRPSLFPRALVVVARRAFHQYCIRLLPVRALTHKRRERLHHGPVVAWALPRNPLERIDAAKPHLQLVAAQLLDRLAEALDNPTLLISLRLRLMP